MSAVEDRIVEMKFENKQFESAARTTMSTFDRLKAALNFSGSNKGLNDLQNTANRFSLGGVANAASGVASKFSAMSVVAIAALANITSKAVDAGLRIVKALTFKPIMDGFNEYETNLNAVQTILANTQASGAKLKDVNAVLQELNTYSDKTIYNFSEMARNIGTFTAAGVDLKTSAAAIKGIANLAALSGSNSQQASTAMYQLSQAISSGKVSLQDWNSVVNAGMGGTVFQRALAQTAEKMGTLDKGAVKLTGKMKNVSIAGKSFRESITAKPGEKSWLTSKVLTETLKQFTGDMSDAELASIGFTKAQIKNIQAQAKTAQDAATQVKTASQLFGTLQESAGSGWAQTFQIILGDFDEAKKLFTEVNNVVGGFISNSAKARNKMLQDWKDLGGRTAALDAIRNIFAALVAVIKPIGEAFRQIFPATTGKQLYALTVAFLNFTKNLKIGADTAKNLKRTFAGVFAIFSIGWSVVKAILNVFGDLFGLIGSKGGSFLEITASVGDFLVKLDQTIKKGDLINKFFEKLGQIISVPIALLTRAGQAIANFFGGFNLPGAKALADMFGRIGDRLSPLAGTGTAVAKAWQGLVKIFQRVAEFLAPAIEAIKQAFSGIGDAIAEAFKSGDFSGVFDALNTGLFAAIILMIKKFMDKGLNIDFGGGLVEGIKNTFGALTDTLQAMQTNIQAKTLLTIAGAVALLTASIVALSLIDSGKLSKSLGALGVAFAQLLGAMAILSKIAGTAGFVKVPVIAASLVILAGAILILSASVVVLSKLKWQDLAKGLLGVAALLAMIVLATRGLDKSSGAMIRVGLAMIPMAVGIKILASAVKDFSTLSWKEIAKGLTALAGALVAIGVAVKLMPKSMILQAAGLVVLSAALKGIASALADMGGLSWEEIGKGLTVMAASLGILVAAMALMTGGIVGAAATVVIAAALLILAPVLERFGDMKWGEIAKALTVLAASLLIFAGALFLMTGAVVGALALPIIAAGLLILAPVLERFGKMKWGEIAKAMVVLAGSLLILAAAVTAMTFALVGAAALVIIASALAVLVPILITLGAMSWASIAKGLLALAAALIVLGLTSAILTPLIPAVLGLGAALLILGAAMALIGVGALALATAFSIFVAAGSAGIVILTGMINLIPKFLTKFAQGIIGFATTLADNASKFVGAFVKLLVALIDAVIIVTPKIGRALNVMIATGLRVVVANAPKFANAGMKILLAFLNAIKQNIGKIVPVVADIIVRFINALRSQQGRVLQAGAQFIISFLNKLASTIRGNSGQLRQAGLRVASAILSGMTGGLSDGAWRVLSAAVGVARRALAAAKSALGINSPSKEFYKLGNWSTEGMALGFSKNSGKVEVAASDVANTALDSMKSVMSGVSDVLSQNIDFDPTIRPVLDLTQLTKDASSISSLIGSKSIVAGVSFGQASGISNSSQNGSGSGINSTVSSGDTFFKFDQTIISPKAPSTIDLYRNTKSLISQARTELTKT